MTQLKNQPYQWHGITQHGKKLTGETSALSIGLARVKLSRQGIEVISIDKKKIHRLSNKKISSLDLILFFRQLSTLISAGVSLHEAIHILCSHTKHRKLLTILDGVKEDIEAGKTLSSSLRKFPMYFDSMTCGLLHTGEMAGTLDQMLERIATLKEKSAEFQSKIIQALMYPAITTGVAIITTIIMLTFVVPRFVDLFQNMPGKLPAITLFIFHLSNWITSYFVWALLFFLCIGMFTYYGMSLPRYKIKLHRFLIQAPVLGVWVTKIMLVRFTYSLAILFAAGIPLTEALQLTEEVVGNLAYRKAVQKLHFDVSTGKQLHSAMRDTALFPPLMQQMVQVGEASGCLDRMLEKITQLYEADINHALNNASKLLEPLIMIILGVLIGGLVIGMYLPIFKLGTVI